MSLFMSLARPISLTHRNRTFSTRFKILVTTLALPIGLAITSTKAFAAFGLTSDTNFYTIDTGANLVFKVRRVDAGSSTQSPGDIASLVYNGVEYQNASRGSQVNAGFDWLYAKGSAASVSAEVKNTDYIKVTVTAQDLTHYYMVRKGYPHIYMATYFKTEPDQHGHVRYILRITGSKLPKGPVPSDVSKNVGAIEASDVFANSNGETRSKHYSNERVIDWQYFGATGSNVGMWFVRDNQEGGSGGPFYRSLKMQTGGDQELTYIVNYGQAQTEAFRPGILNNYTLVVTNGSAPSTTIDTSWFKNMGLLGYLDSSARGRIAGVGLSNTDTNFNYTLGFSNDIAQYWTKADLTSKGYFSSTNMRPGTYAMTVYKNELAVEAGAVTVTAGESTTLNSIKITNDPANDARIWSIGHWDGSPKEFLNGDKLTTMHPSDPRMANWDTEDFYIGTTPNNHFPAYIWKDINNDRAIYFKLKASQIAQKQTLRVGLTTAFSGGRPNITVNNWTSKFQTPSKQPSSRTLTTGSYRGNNVTYYFDIPASAWNTDPNAWNKLTLSLISGSGSTAYLSAGVSIDAIDLLETPAAVASSSKAASSSSVVASSSSKVVSSSSVAASSSSVAASSSSKAASSSSKAASSSSKAASSSSVAASSSSTAASSSSSAPVIALGAFNPLSVMLLLALSLFVRRQRKSSNEKHQRQTSTKTGT
ncbi:MAG: rhamnogalacturonan lyase B N-terminal domain-containing protein [Marinagarivorans sp.]|nr:rhamnogalacturonan lyase B N-terminal domain-containing protein [Marinagarivorans sp.]